MKRRRRRLLIPNPRVVNSLTRLCLVLVFLNVWVGANILAEEVGFEKPLGMAIDRNGNLLVAEIDRNCVTILTPELKTIRRITEIQGYGRLSRPFDVKVFKGRYYVLDSGNNTVVVADRDWHMLYKIGSGMAGSRPGEFTMPHFLAIAPDGTLFVSDTLNHRIQKFDADGKWIGSIDGTSIGGTFPINMPSGIAVLADGHLVVAEYGDHPAVIADRDGSVIRTLDGSGAAYCVHATADRIYIVATYSDLVSIYAYDGKLLAQLTSGRGDVPQIPFNKPGGVVTDAEGSIFVNDWRNRRIQKLAADGTVQASVGHRTPTPVAEPNKMPRTQPDRPVALGAFVGLLSPSEIQRYYDAGVHKYYFQPGEDILSPRLKAAVDAVHALGAQAAFVFDTYYQGARESSIYDTPNHLSLFANTHPEFFTRKRDGKTFDKTMLSYVYPQVRRWKIQQIVQALEASGADGVVLDYIRWPAGNSDGYDAPAVEHFHELYGVSAFDVPPTDPRWVRLRASYITDFLRELREARGSFPRKVTVGVYIDADPESELTAVGRDWPTWSKEGLIDELHQMLYTDNFQAIYDGVRVGRSRGGKSVRVVSCIDVYAGYLTEPDLLRRGARTSFLAGADEVVVVRDGAIERHGLFAAMKQIRADFTNETEIKALATR